MSIHDYIMRFPRVKSIIYVWAYENRQELMRVWVSVSATAWPRLLGGPLSDCRSRDCAQFLSWLLVVIQGEVRPPKEMREVCDGILGLVAHAAQGVSLLEEAREIEDCQRGLKRCVRKGNTLKDGLHL
jgi:hypothetical protein